MPRVNIYLSDEMQKRLAEYWEREWGGHHSFCEIIWKISQAKGLRDPEYGYRF